MKDQAPWGQFSSPCLLGIDRKYSGMSLAGKTLKSGDIVIDNVSLNNILPPPSAWTQLFWPHYILSATFFSWLNSWVLFSN